MVFPSQEPKKVLIERIVKALVGKKIERLWKAVQISRFPALQVVLLGIQTKLPSTHRELRQLDEEAEAALRASKAERVRKSNPYIQIVSLWQIR